MTADPSYKGARPGHPAIAQFMAGRTPNIVAHDVYTNKHISLLAAIQGGDTWTNWYTAMSTYLQGNQEIGGHADGSWYMAPGGGPDPGASGWNPTGGRLFCTTFSVLSLVPEMAGLRVLED